MSVWVEAGQSAEAFWGQTPKTHQAIIRGAQRREQSRLELAIAQAWHTENFRRAGRKFKDLDHYLKRLRAKPKRAQTAEEVFAVFESLAARGKAIKIRQR